MTLFRTQTVLAAAFGSAMLIGSSQAANIVFEAEDFTTNANFTTVVDTSASEGSAITAPQGTTLPPDNKVTYDLTFDTAGTYYLYMLFKTDAENSGPNAVFDGNLSDSLFMPTDFGSAPNASDWQKINDLRLVGDPNVYGWVNLSTWPADGSTSDAGVSYTVAAPGTLTLGIGGREDGLTIDAFVLSTESNLDSAALDALVPEPASASLLALGGIMLMKRRRRHEA